MHKIDIPERVLARVARRIGRTSVYETLDPKKTALVVVDMQNYFMKPGFQGEVPMAREIVPNVNRLAAGLRAAGGHVVWIKNSTTATRESWSTYHAFMATPERAERRLETMDETHEGHRLWAELEVAPQDAEIVKKRFSAFIQGSSAIEAHLRARGIDTVLITGTATNVCCESSARDAMMLNFKVVMVTDATATHSDEDHNNSLAAFYSNFGDLKSTDECLAALGAMPLPHAAE